MKLKLLALLFLIFYVTVNYSQWTQTNGPLSCGVKCILNDGSTLYIGTTSGVYYSVDNGNSWQPMNNGWTQTIVNPAVISIVKIGSTLFAATSNGAYKYNGSNWILISSYTQSNTNYLPSNLTCLVVTTDQKLFAGTQSNGIYRSVNLGTTWELISPANTGVNCMATTGNTVFAGTTTGIISYVENQTWTSVLQASSILSLVVSGNGSVIYAGTNNGRIYKSLNNGANWIYYVTGTNFLLVKAMAVNETGTLLYAGIYDGFLTRTTNGGSSWTDINTDKYAVRSQCLALVGNNLLIGTNAAGLIRYTPNSNTYESLNIGCRNSFISTLIVKDSQLIAGVPGNGIFKSIDEGNTWIKSVSGFSSIDCMKLEVSGSKIYGGGTNIENNGMYVSTNNGDTWTGQLLPIDVTSISAIGNTVLAGSMATGVYISANGGTNWIQTNTGLTNTYITNLTNDGTNFYAGTSKGLFKLTNGSSSWSQVVSEIFSGSYGGYINAFAINGTSLFVGTIGKGLYRSLDAGVTWQQFNSSTNNVSINQVNCILINLANIFIGTNKGVFYSQDYGDTWVYSNGLNTQINSLALNGNKIYAGTGMHSVWQNNISSLTSTHSGVSNIPTEYRLNQNFPNPFNPSTIISYQIPAFSKVSLKVYDVLGNEVATLVNESKASGYYEVKFDGSHLSSGVYLYKLQSDLFVQTKKFVLMK